MAIGERMTTMALATWVGAVTNSVVPSQRDPDGPERAPAWNASHAGTHLPKDPNVTDADAFSAAHPGLANFLFWDGSVRAVTSAISIPVYQALASRAGGEVVDY